MGMKPPRTPYEEWLALDEKVRAEFIDGKIMMLDAPSDAVTLPSPSGAHQYVQGELGDFVRALVRSHADCPNGWWILCDYDVRLGENVLRPDLVGWRRERSPRLPERPVELRPDWACEIVSPSNTNHDRVTKRRLYAEHGVPHYWVIDPMERTLEALALCDGTWIEIGVYDEEDVARIAPFDAVELEIGRLFVPREEEDGESGEDDGQREEVASSAVVG